MAYYQNNRRPKNFKKPKLRLGDQVFFHASIRPGDKNNIIACRGLVIRSPHREQPCYKIIITGVQSCPGAVSLLGKRLLRGEDQLAKDAPEWFLNNTFILYNPTKIREVLCRAISNSRR